MTDMTTLVSGLSNYERQLQQHSLRVSKSFQELTRALDRLHHAWEGTSANEFKAHFARTKEALEQYLEGTKTIRHLLNERIDRLAEADRGGMLSSSAREGAQARASTIQRRGSRGQRSPEANAECLKASSHYRVYTQLTENARLWHAKTGEALRAVERERLAATRSYWEEFIDRGSEKALTTLLALAGHGLIAGTYALMFISGGAGALSAPALAVLEGEEEVLIEDILQTIIGFAFEELLHVSHPQLMRRVNNARTEEQKARRRYEHYRTKRNEALAKRLFCCGR